jgi:hypothetical protein
VVDDERHERSAEQFDDGPARPADRVAALRAQRQALEAEIAETARLVELATKRDGQSQAPAQKDAEVAIPPLAGR